MPNQRVPPEDEARIVELYRSKLRPTLREISEMMNWSTTAVRNSLVRNGVPLRRRGESNWKTKQLPQAEALDTLRLYEEEGLTIKEIAKLKGKHVSTIHERLTTNGAKMRPSHVNYRRYNLEGRDEVSSTIGSKREVG